MIYTIKLTKKEEVANGTMAFYFEKPADFTFRAGQFCDITLIDPPETDEEGNTRGFSLITTPSDSLVGVATRLRDTAFKRVLRELPIGSEVKFDAPYGDFTLHKNEATPAVFLIGGIGVTPVLSMVKQATADKTNHEIVLLHASRAPADLPFAADFAALVEQNPHFSYVPVVSDDAPADWKGESGRIDGDIVKKYVSDFTTPKFYLSGPEGMVKAMRELLVSLGADEDNIKTEEFTGY